MLSVISVKVTYADLFAALEEVFGELGPESECDRVHAADILSAKADNAFVTGC